jgi:hypothetical protein
MICSPLYKISLFTVFNSYCRFLAESHSVLVSGISHSGIIVAFAKSVTLNYEILATEAGCFQRDTSKLGSSLMKEDFSLFLMTSLSPFRGKGIGKLFLIHTFY